MRNVAYFLNLRMIKYLLFIFIGKLSKTFSLSDCWIYDNEIDVNIKHETIVDNTATS